jgi:DNA-directed RNA polymerase subunit K
MKYTKYEVARIIGARALQLAMGAPLLIKQPKNVMDTVILATLEYTKGVLPITIKRPKPVKLNISI